LNNDEKLVVYSIKDTEVILDYQQLNDKLRNLLNHILATPKDTENTYRSLTKKGDGTIINIDIPLVGVKLLSLVHDNEDDNKTTTPCSDCITATLTVKVGN
jgi:hypothetical protein